MRDDEREFGDFGYLNIPRECKKCGGVMVFQGVGEYQCEECKNVDYDNYGKVRCYIERHRGATATEIEIGTGVKQRIIRNMLKEGRLEITKESKVFLYCEVCRKEIRSGRFCPECEVNYHRRLEEKQRQLRNAGMQGFGRARGEATGEKRFRREQ